jgi:hypothetical protein
VTAPDHTVAHAVTGASPPAEPIYEPVYFEEEDDPITEMVEDPITVVNARPAPSARPPVPGPSTDPTQVGVDVGGLLDASGGAVGAPSGPSPLRPVVVDDEIGDDPATVQLQRMPVAFISESVMDPETVVDHRPDATRWREETQARIDEMPRGPLPSGIADRSGPTLAHDDLTRPQVYRDERDDDDDDGEFDRNVIWIGLVIGAVSGFVAVLVFVAWFAGRV